MMDRVLIMSNLILDWSDQYGVIIQFYPSWCSFFWWFRFSTGEDLIGAFYLSNGSPTLASDKIFDENVDDGSFQVVVFGDDVSTEVADGFLVGQEFIWAFKME